VQTRAELWCKELVAVLFAARSLGPAPLLAVLSLEYSFLPSLPAIAFDENCHRKHPPTIWRLQASADYLKGLYDGYDFLAEELLAYRDAWELDLNTRFRDPEQIKKKRETEEEQYAKIISMFCQHIATEINKLDIPFHALSAGSIERCLLRLERHQPIGSQGNKREELQRRIREHRRRGIQDKDELALAFKGLLPEFNEVPLDLPSILASGFAARRKIFGEFEDPPGGGNASDTANSLCLKLDVIGSKIADSIRAARVHTAVMKRMGTGSNMQKVRESS
jgi:hypothetical protein